MGKGTVPYEFPAAIGMAEPTTILNADRGRGMTAALVFLCALAGAQILFIGLALMQRTEVKEPPVVQAKDDPADGPAAPLSDSMARVTPPEPGMLAAPQVATPAAPQAVVSYGPPPIGSFEMPAGQAPVPVPVPAPMTAAVQAATVRSPIQESVPLASVPATSASLPQTVETLADPATNMSREEMVGLAKQVRSLGDMQGALEVLRKADLRFPGSPEVTAELAQCYEEMGLTAKSSALWRQLQEMSPERAGGWRDLAKRRLQAPPAPASQTQGLDFMPQTLSLGACRARRDTNFTNGEKVVLNIPILRRGNVPVDPALVDINVYFFDRVNGREISQTIADDPPTAWTAPPVDWAGIGEEPLEVTYFMPNLTPGEVAAHGKRAYHGYVVRLYYQNKLQDVAAEPRDLLDFGAPTARADLDGMNPLLPPATQ